MHTREDQDTERELTDNELASVYGGIGRDIGDGLFGILFGLFHREDFGRIRVVNLS